MFRDCARLERDVFVTWKEDDVDEQDVDERKECWERKKVLSHIWVKSESDLDQISTRSLTSFNQSWYARNTLLREAKIRNEAQCEDIKLKNCQIQNKILYKDSQLWVSFNEFLQMNLIHEMHNQFSINHFDIFRMMKIIKRNYYWLFMQKTVDQYIWNCYVY